MSRHEFPAGPPILEAPNGGTIDFGATGDTPPVFAQAAAVDLRCVAFQPVPGRNNVLPVRRHGAVRVLAGLKGRTVAVTRGSSAQPVLVQALRQAGLPRARSDPPISQRETPLPFFPRGAVGAWAIRDPFLAMAAQDPAARVLTTADGIAPGNSFFLPRQAAADAPELIGPWSA